MDYQNLTPDTVLAGFGAGIDCSQQVFTHFADRLGLDEETALKISSAFGGGMWNGETCGCVSAALMAIGMKYGHTEEGDVESKNKMLEKKAAFEKAFTEKYQSLLCKELLGYDLSKPEEMEKIMEQQLLAKVCPGLVCAACDILEEIL